ncbi:SdiA-regulated domain-containing protein [Flavobacterium sp. F-328]|uniref:SdiA-regulated domain-containing protein n=1 Tax=Flavobacterium erciyesense TaxID=2825842 RepID=A0ABS5D289_9FLAO|nr:SdiA-regulated domain-containing protein [Flavobacterium erciyesense]MBQ0908116.1 SdiA-regulated domain-containing protein [Flavobacterium erciyesense]
MKKHWIPIIALFAGACQQDSTVLQEQYELPKKLKEVSGITFDTKAEMLWALADSGNPNKIYGLDKNGSIAKTCEITNATNTDWEDITQDKEGNIYIGDFGNNDNERKDLVIYKVDHSSLTDGEANAAYEIAFYYPEQKEFPPSKKELLYDVEGFFEHEGYFYLFTKNRSKNFDGTSLLYQVPNKAGTHAAVLLGSLKTCDSYNHCAITSATISPDGAKVALLTHDKLILLEGYSNGNFLKGTQTTLELGHFSQKESAVFIDNETILIADEKAGSDGGKLYKTSLKNLKSKS